MLITAAMLRQLEEAIAPDAVAEIRIYPAGCDIRVHWNNRLRMLNKNIAYQEIGDVNGITDDRMQRAWDRLIKHMVEVSSRKPS